MPYLRTLDKGLLILETIFASHQGIGTRALAHQLKINPTTVHNIAQTFCKRGYLRQDPETKSFSPGIRLMLLGRHPSYLRSLSVSASSIVDDVARKLNESITLGSIDHGRIINLKYIPSKQALRVHEPEDASAHSHCTAFGKVLLASLNETALEAYLQETPLTAFTAKTITDPAKLRGELSMIRDRHYARTCDEFTEGVSAVAVPIHDPWGSIIASIGASAPTLRMQKEGQFEESLGALKAAAKEIEQLWSENMHSNPKKPLKKKKAN